jgi:hypothetical protein
MKRHAAVMAGVVLLVGLAATLFGERIGINRGQGWDGQAYVAWGQDFGARVLHDGVTAYLAQRVLPSAIVYAADHVLGIEGSIPNVIRAFQVLDLAMLVAAAVLWAHLALAVMRWRAATAWVGFAALFGCFANAKHALYNQALTDSTAFALGMLLVWGYLARRPVAVWIACALGAWTFPPLPLLGFALLVLPRPAEPVPPVACRRRVQWAAAALAAAGTAVLLIIAATYYLHPVPNIGCEKFAAWVRTDLLWLTVPLLAAMLGVGGYLIAAEPRAWSVIAYARTLRARRVAITVVACGVIVLARAWWVARVGTRGEGSTFANQFLCEHGNAMLRGPIWGPVHHVVYFGPIAIVAMFAWRRIAQLAAEWGPAIPLALVMMLAFAAGSQSRQWIHLFPLLVALAAAATDGRWSPVRAAIFIALALAWSKLWFHIGFEVVQPWFEQPAQRYYMHLGQWTSDGAYVIHLVAALVTAGVIALLTWLPARASNAHD